MYKVLDLACGRGGASRGYAQAGFEVVGVDIEPQPGYPYEFHQGDLLRWLEWDDLGEYDLIHVSPPCQRWSKQVRCRPELREKYPDLITPVRPLLQSSGVPYVIENVEGAPLIEPVWLCGFTFNRELYRHRGFEAGNGLVIPQPFHPKHTKRASKAGHWVPGTVMSVAGHIAPIEHARKIMEIDWMPWEALAESIPPYYTAYVGAHAMAQFGRRAA